MAKKTQLFILNNLKFFGFGILEKLKFCKIVMLQHKNNFKLDRSLMPYHRNITTETINSKQFSMLLDRFLKRKD